ncbi:Metallo-dependent phosphatase-like protein [Crassisporium funariophilum]|nr:Metallo-dependent phosphatase-like protein [Crassisporium funariophilum]
MKKFLANIPIISPSAPAATTSRTDVLNDETRYGNVVLTSPKEIVYLEYPPSQLAPPLSDEWTRFVCISDTHSRAFHVPDGDVLLHSGDLTTTGTVGDFKKTMEWLYSLPHKIKIVIGGNHDLTLHSEWYETNFQRFHFLHGKQNVKPIMEMLKGPRALKAGIVYLQDEEYRFQTKKDGKLWSVYGSPWSPEFNNWAFNYEREDAEELISKFPKTDILLTHGPAHKIFDRTNRGVDAGCEALRARLPELRPRLHVVGHIHEAHGAHIHAWDPTTDLTPPSVQFDDEELTRDHTSATTSNQERETELSLERTVFVNAANWPSGSQIFRDGVKSDFGGPGFQAIVVDLKE